MADILGVSFQAVEAIFVIHARLERIRDAPLDIQLFTAQTSSVANLVEYFGIHFPTTIKRLSEDERTQARKQIGHLKLYFSLVEKTTDSAAGIILRTFVNRDSTAWQRFWNKWRWTSKQTVITEARISMTLLMTSVQMFMNTVALQLLCKEADRFSPENQTKL